MSEYDFTSAPYDDVPELQLPPANRKAEFTITDVEPSETKGDPEQGKPKRPMLVLTIEFNDQTGTEYEQIRHWLTFPTEEELFKKREGSLDADEKRTVDMMIRGTNRFCHLFGVDPKSLPDGLRGAKARGTVTHAPNENDPQNPYVRLVVPRAR